MAMNFFTLKHICFHQPLYTDVIFCRYHFYVRMSSVQKSNESEEAVRFVYLFALYRATTVGLLGKWGTDINAVR